MLRNPTKVVCPPPTHLNVSTQLLFEVNLCLLDPWPGCERHDAMVDHVEHGQVTELLPQQKEQGVKVVNKLGEEIPPSHVQCIHCLIGLWNKCYSFKTDLIISQPPYLSSPQADRASCTSLTARSWPSSARSRGWAGSAAGCTQSGSWWCHRVPCLSWTWVQLSWKQANIASSQKSEMVATWVLSGVCQLGAVSLPDDVVVEEAGGGRGPGRGHEKPVINPDIRYVIIIIMIILWYI